MSNGGKRDNRGEGKGDQVRGGDKMTTPPMHEGIGVHRTPAATACPDVTTGVHKGSDGGRTCVDVYVQVDLPVVGACAGDGVGQRQEGQEQQLHQLQQQLQEAATNAQHLEDELDETRCVGSH